MLGGENMERLLKIVKGGRELFRLRVDKIDIRVFRGIVSVNQFGHVEVELTDSENCNVSVDSRKVEVEVYSEVEK